jgi:hypothetical protein
MSNDFMTSAAKYKYCKLKIKYFGTKYKCKITLVITSTSSALNS